jgi:hypothetical protein
MSHAGGGRALPSQLEKRHAGCLPQLLGALSAPNQAQGVPRRASAIAGVLAGRIYMWLGSRKGGQRAGWQAAGARESRVAAQGPRAKPTAWPAVGARVMRQHAHARAARSRCGCAGTISWGACSSTSSMQHSAAQPQRRSSCCGRLRGRRTGPAELRRASSAASPPRGVRACRAELALAGVCAAAAPRARCDGFAFCRRAGAAAACVAGAGPPASPTPRREHAGRLLSALNAPLTPARPLLASPAAGSLVPRAPLLFSSSPPAPPGARTPAHGEPHRPPARTRAT